MNKIFKGLLVAVMFTSMCACSSDETSQSSQVETSELSLSFFDASVESFDKTRADDDAPKTLKDYFDQLDIAIIPQDKTQNPNEIHVKQSSTDADFGKLSTRLPIGTYTKNISLDHTGTLSTVKINFSTFIPEETVSLTVDIKLYSADNTPVRSLHFDDVKVQQGHVTTYTGPLFSAGSSLNFAFDNVSLVKSDYDVSFGD